jgi:hypothetical protein
MEEAIIVIVIVKGDKVMTEIQNSLLGELSREMCHGCMWSNSEKSIVQYIF